MQIEVTFDAGGHPQLDLSSSTTLQGWQLNWVLNQKYQDLLAFVKFKSKAKGGLDASSLQIRVSRDTSSRTVESFRARSKIGGVIKKGY